MSLRLRQDELEWREIDRDIVVLDARNAAYLTLNGSGACCGGCLPRAPRETNSRRRW